MKKITLILLAATFIFQWYVPLNMIMQQENILKEGTAFKFKTEPIDPNDPFRGKYIVLNYEANEIEVPQNTDLYTTESVFVKIQNGSDGFAEIAGLEKMAPTANIPYVKAIIISASSNETTKTLRVAYPFERFYMEESKAPKAEALFRDIWRDSTINVYGLVVINEGKAVLQDVMVDGVPIKDAVMNSDIN